MLAFVAGAVSAASALADDAVVDANGQRMMPIPDGVALSWKVDCFWGEPISYGGKTFRAMGYANGQMINFMDIEASYWPARFKLAPGEKLVFARLFPPRPLLVDQLLRRRRADVVLVDVDIEPDAGSTNPFRQGARRDTPDDQRRYTITVINEPEPANRRTARPTRSTHVQRPSPTISWNCDTALISSTSPRRTPSTSAAECLWPRPSSLSLPAARNARARRSALAIGQWRKRCSSAPLRRTQSSSWWQAFPCTDKTPKGAFCNDPFTAPAQNPPVTEKFFGIPYSLRGLFLPPEQRAKLKPPNSCKLAKGFEGNADNAYMMTFLNNHFGKVVEFRGRYPRTPRTYFDNKVWNQSKADLRYWSVMSGNEPSSTQIAGGDRGRTDSGKQGRDVQHHRLQARGPAEDRDAGLRPCLARLGPPWRLHRPRRADDPRVAEHAAGQRLRPVFPRGLRTGNREGGHGRVSADRTLLRRCGGV